MFLQVRIELTREVFILSIVKEALQLGRNLVGKVPVRRRCCCWIHLLGDGLRLNLCQA
jgi:hypothetical protein